MHPDDQPSPPGEGFLLSIFALLFGENRRFVQPSISVDLPESAKLTSVTTELEPANELSTDPAPEPPSPVELQEKLNSPLQVPLARIMARNAGYRIEEGLVLPAGEGSPSVEYLRSLLNIGNRALTAKKIQQLIEGNPQWGFYFDDFGELWGF